MLFKLMNRYKFALPTIYISLFLCMLLALSYLLFLQVTAEGFLIKDLNPSAFLVPVLAYLSIGLVGVTIGFTRKTASEKNALDFAKEMGTLSSHMQALADLRRSMSLNNGNLDRREASRYMEGLSDLVNPKLKKSFAADQDLPNEPGAGGSDQKPAQPKPSPKAEPKGKPEAANDERSQEEIDWEHRKAAFALLNALESCANAIRYGIYDEDFIYNIYGSHFIEWYELMYGLIKTRQLKQERIWVNFEWLAVKWTLRRNITGVISKESRKTSYIINESLEALKMHKKVKPLVRKLRRFEAKLERRKFPM
ncbi:MULTISPECIES: DUF4760 domain-containing protein [Pseudomonas]|uniref:DUF4760 domain-containing protein n=1 Tax=Pseudomonas TaxID=286 RepID=UPI000F05EF69|nr:DUF4760 domain-containing protein [Pseudomonas viridiflava]